jgi:hypothetical protein
VKLTPNPGNYKLTPVSSLLASNPVAKGDNARRSPVHNAYVYTRFTGEGGARRRAMAAGVPL